MKKLEISDVRDSGEMRVIYTAMWSGQEAEFSDRKIRGLVRALGWPVLPWWRRLFSWVARLWRRS